MTPDRGVSRRKPRCTLLAAALMLGLMGDLHAFAAEAAGAAATTSPAEAKQVKPGEADLKSKGLLTVDQVYSGMLKADEIKAAIERADPAVDHAQMKQEWGVKVISVSYAADGFWLAFRFRVLDPVKANDLFDTKYKPYLESEASGVKLAVPTAAKVGALRTTNRGHNIKAGKIYTIMFSNPGFQVQPGQKVTVVSGDFKVEHMTVRGSRQNLSVKGMDEK